MIKVYHSPKARSVRVIWLLQELGTPYEVETMPFTPEALKSPRYLAVHPMGKIPAIEDGDLTLFESGAICQYLLERYGGGRLEPAVDSPERGRYLQWFHFGEATALPPLGDFAQHTMFLPEAERIPAVVESAKTRIDAVAKALEAAVAGREFLCGDFTAADVMCGYAVALMAFLGFVGDAHPGLAAYVQRLQARPAFEVAFA